jgi:hypothetical protein
MKSRCIRTIASLTLLLLLVSGARREASAQESAPLSMEDACHAAQERLRVQEEAGYTPDWADAVLDDPIELYDLSDAISAYLFPLHRPSGGESAGYLIVAAVDVPNPVLEFSPDAPSPYRAARAVAEELAHTRGMELCAERPLYLGVLSYGYELAPIGRCGDTPTAPIRRTVDLLNTTVLEIEAERARVPLSQMLPSAHPVDLQAPSSPAAYKLIAGVPDCCQFKSGSCWSGCAPTASANVLGFWDTHGYPNLQAGGDWQQLVLDLGSHMSTNCGSTYINYISPGMANYAQTKGYYFESAMRWPAASYDLFRNEIDANHPIVVDIIGAVEYWGANHSVTGVGYQDSGSYMIVHDALACGANQGDHYIHYGSGYYSSIGMHPTEPDQTPPSQASSVRPDGWSGPYTDDESPRFRWNPASDSGSGIAGYYVAVDDWTPDGGYGNDWWVGNVTAFTVPGPLPDGEHIFAVTSKDNAGHVNPSDTNQPGAAPCYTFHVDTTAPTNPTSVNSGCGAQDDVWQRDCTDPDFAWSGANDQGGSGVRDYHVYWGTDPSGSPDVWRTTANHNPGSMSTPGQVAVYYLRTSTRDNLGHESAPGTIFTLRYDRSQPTGNPVVNGGAETVHSVDVLVEPNGQDTGSGLARAHLSNDGEDWQTQGYATTLYWSLLPRSRTWHTVYIELGDGAGNRSSTYSRRVCLDPHPAHPASAGYRLWGAGPIASGGRLTSGRYRLDHTVGASSAGELLTSAGYRLRSGFQAMWPATPGDVMFTVFRCGGTVYVPLVVRNH